MMAPAATVAGFFAALDHPLKPVLRAVCTAILRASPAISEGIKWNAPSYFVGDQAYFATVNIHTRGKAPPAVLVILHRGAKARPGRVTIADPAGLIEWLGPDRAAVRFGTPAEVRKQAGALQAIVRAWIKELAG